MNEETIDETGSPQGKELAYELTRRGFGLAGLDWVESSLGQPELAWASTCWLAVLGPHTWSRVHLGVARIWARREPGSATPGSAADCVGVTGSELAGGERAKKKEEEKEKEKEKEREKRE